MELDLQVSPEEIMSREVELDPQVSPEEIMSREVELGCESWTSLASGQRCNGHCPCDSAPARQLKQQLRSALVAAQWRGDTASFLCSGGGPRSLRSFSGGLHGRAQTPSTGFRHASFNHCRI